MKDASAADWTLSERMLDYWISFATSLDPNDGLGHARSCYSCLCLALLICAPA